MKFSKAFTLLLVIASLASCKKDEPEDQFVGTWKITKLVTTGCTDPTENQNLTFTDGCYKEALSGFELCQTAVFNSNNTYTLTTKTVFFGVTDNEIENGTYSVSGNKLKLCPTNGSCEDSEFSISGKTLTVTNNDSDTKCKTVLTLSKQ